MKNLEILRQNIDVIDKEIILLLGKRTKCQTEIAQYKLKHKLPIYQPDREKLLVNNVVKLAKNVEVCPYFVRNLYRLILKESQKVQGQILPYDNSTIY